MAKPPKLDAASLGVRERVLLFCVGSGTDWQRAGQAALPIRRCRSLGEAKMTAQKPFARPAPGFPFRNV
jgi:hypothetical protein